MPEEDAAPAQAARSSGQGFLVDWSATRQEGAARKGYWAGTHRLVCPEATLERVRPRMGELGITRLANVTGLDRIGVPVVLSCRPASRSLAVSQGKGLTLAAARVSALMESIEGYHAERISRPQALAPPRELERTHEIADLSRLPRTARQGLDSDTSFRWVEGVDLKTGAPVWLPLESVSLDFRLPEPEGSGWFLKSSNGVAAGNHLLEAVSHAICELIERDAFTLWNLLSFSQAADTKLDLDSVEDDAVQDLLARFRRAEIAVAAWETTSDLAVPSYFATILDLRSNSASAFAASGFGCHPAREIALLRALTEAAQSRLTVISGARDDMLRSNYIKHASPGAFRRQRQTIEGYAPRRSFAEAPTRAGETFADDIAWMLRRLQVAGLSQVMLVDLTIPEIGIPVVRVVIPGLEAACVAPEDHRLGERGRAAVARP